MRRMLFLAAAGVLLAASGASAQNACLPYEPETVTLEGQIFEYREYGPPGYGETPDKDRQTFYMGFTPTYPICTRDGQSRLKRAERQVAVLQASFDEGISPHPLLGKKVVVTGKLHHRRAGRQYTPVLIHVTRVQAK